MIPTLQLGQFGRGVSSPAAPQPTFSNVSLLIHGNARPFVDASLNKFPVCNYAGRATLSSSSLYTGNTANHTKGLVVPASTAFQFGTGAWAITAKVKCGTGGARIFDTRTTASSSGAVAFVVQATTLYPYVFVNGTNYGLGTPAANMALTANVEADVAVSYDGTVLRMFVNGALSWSHTVSLNVSANNDVYIANDAYLADGLADQYTRELMVVKGEAVYTAAYTPETTHADTGIVIESYAVGTYSNVKLNLHGSGTNGGTTFTDTSNSARTVSAFGNVQTSTAQARIGSSSILFDGTGDYLTVPASADWAFGTGDYSVESQCYRADNTLRVIMSSYGGSADGWTSQVNLTTAGRVTYNETGDGVDADSVDGLSLSATWQHVAVGRYGTLLMMFVEGELIYVTASSQSITNSIALYIGRLTNVVTTRDWNGHQQEIRVVKGETPYKRSFVPQTAAHPDS